MKHKNLLSVSILITLGLLSSRVSAQSIEDIVQRAQALPGGQFVSTTAPDPIPFAQVHSNGDVFALIRTESGKDLLFYDGQVVLEEGQSSPLNGAPGLIDELHHAYLTENGKLAWIATLSDPGGNPGVFVAVDDTVIEIAGQLALFSGLSGAIWNAFRFVHLSEDGTKLSIQGNVQFISGPRDIRVFVTLGPGNNVLARETVAVVDGAQPGLPFGVGIDALRGEWFQFQPSENGTHLFSAEYDSTQQPGPESGLWSRQPNPSAQNQSIFQTGPILPNLGGYTDGVVDTGHSINDLGEMAFVLAIDPTNGNPEFDLLVRNTGAYVSPPFPQAALPGFHLSSFAESPMQLSSEDELFWMGNYENGSLNARILFKELDPIVVPGVTQVGQDVITEVDPWGGAFDISTTGEWMVFSGRLDGDYTLFRYRLEEEYESFCWGDGGTSPGCTSCPCGNESTLAQQGGCLNSSGESALLFSQGRAGISGDSLRFRVEGAVPNSFGILVSAQNRLPNQGPCSPGSGITSPVIDGLRCVGGALVRHGTRATNSNGQIGSGNNGWGPPHGPLGGLVLQGGFGAGQTRHFQCFYRDQIDQGCMRGQNTTNAVTVRVAP